MRKIINIIAESMLSEDAHRIVSEPNFPEQVRQFMGRNGLSDWIDDYQDDNELREAAIGVLSQISAMGYMTSGEIGVARAELRPTKEVKALQFGSVGCYWTWHTDSARVCHHDNAYDTHGRKNLVEVVFDGFASLDAVDWVATIAQNLSLPGEREITLKDHALVQIDAIYVGRDYKDVDLKLPVAGNR